MTGHDLQVLLEGFLYGMLTLGFLERVAFPVSFILYHRHVRHRR